MANGLVYNTLKKGCKYDVLARIFHHITVKATTLSTYRISAGTEIYKGRVAGGSGEQILVLDPLKEGVKLVSSEPLPVTIINTSDAPIGSLLD